MSRRVGEAAWRHVADLSGVDIQIEFQARSSCLRRTIAVWDHIFSDGNLGLILRFPGLAEPPVARRQPSVTCTHHRLRTLTAIFSLMIVITIVCYHLSVFISGAPTPCQSTPAQCDMLSIVRAAWLQPFSAANLAIVPRNSARSLLTCWRHSHISSA